MNQKLRILHVVRQFHPAIGGLESYVKNMAHHQQRLGHECAVLTLDRFFHGDGSRLPPQETVEGIPVRRVPFIGGRRFFVPLVPPSILNDFDVVHVHNTDGFFDVLSLMCKAVNKPAFATTHGGFFHTNDFAVIKRPYFRLITRSSGRRYRALFAISENDYTIFRGTNANLLLKPNAVVPPGDFLASGESFVYLGRLSKNKNLPALIETYAILRTKHHAGGRLHIIGPEWDVTAGELSALAERLGIGEAVTFHGFADVTALQDILRDCGWFVSASSFEGFGMAMLEAMSVGLIPFVQPNGSFRELVKSGGVGMCVDFTNPAEAAAQIGGHLDPPSGEEREKASRFARTFAWEKLADDTITAYREYGTQ
ncbi:MAG: glycosyltransferase family 1 protein [Alphaproteobacteria bacterium]|nr:glycosyltransferase family 1 protein [Alphaproteobacteria bacterium]